MMKPQYAVKLCSLPAEVEALRCEKFRTYEAIANVPHCLAVAGVVAKSPKLASTKPLLCGGRGIHFPLPPRTMQMKGLKMKIMFSAVAAFVGSLVITHAGPADDVSAAAKKLGGESSYSWHTTVVVPEDSQFKPGPTDGKSAEGMNYVKLSFGDNTTEIFMKGTNAVLSNPDGGWQTLADLANDDQGPGRFMVGMVRNFRTPAEQAADLAAGVKDLQETNGAYAGELTPDAAKRMLSFRRAGAGASNASGTAQFWMANGELTKYEFHVKGTVSFGGNDRDIDRDTTVEIKDVGATKIEMPGDAKKLMP
jgi:hypothetical protein